MPPGPESKPISYQDAPHALAQDLEKHNYAAAREVLEQFNDFIRTSVATSAMLEVNKDREKNPHLPKVDIQTGTDKNGEYLSDITVQTGNSKSEIAYKDTGSHLPLEAAKKIEPSQTNRYVEWLRNLMPWSEPLKKASDQGK